MGELAIRFCIGGFVVSLFALVGDLFKPKSFAGLFGAAPSVALATLALTARHTGPRYAAVEARSMLAGAAALFAYCCLVTWLLKRQHAHALTATTTAIVAWFAVAFGLWLLFLR